MFEEAFNLERLPEVVKSLMFSFPNQRIFLFVGEMGAGKTTFIKELCKQLGVSKGLSSPTYSIVNEYITNQGLTIYHFDLYRLQKAEELIDLGFSEYLQSGNYCFIEWPEIGIPFYDNALHLDISVNEEIRKLIVYRLNTNLLF